jgi:Lipocalin-like domain
VTIERREFIGRRLGGQYAQSDAGAAVSKLPLSAVAADDQLVGTFKLVSEQRKIVDTGEIVSMPNPLGYISYSKDGRMIALIVRRPRPQPESVDKITDQQRVELFNTMTAYGGTYTFDGNKVEHHIDISWNEAWTGMTVIRDLKKEGDKLIYTTRPAPFTADGKMSVFTVVWEKVK